MAVCHVSVTFTSAEPTGMSAIDTSSHCSSFSPRFFTRRLSWCFRRCLLCPTFHMYTCHGLFSLGFTIGLGLYRVSGVHTGQRSVPRCTCCLLAPFGQYSLERYVGLRLENPVQPIDLLMPSPPPYNSPLPVPSTVLAPVYKRGSPPTLAVARPPSHGRLPWCCLKRCWSPCAMWHTRGHSRECVFAAVERAWGLPIPQSPLR